MAEVQASTERKTCARCGEEQPLSSFRWHRDRRRFGGGYPNATCRACELDSRRQRYELNADAERERVRRWKRENPELLRAQAERRRRRSGIRSRRDVRRESEEKRRTRDIAATKRRALRAEVAYRNRLLRKRAQRRAVVEGAINPEEIQALLDSARACAYCGAPFESMPFFEDDRTIDHVIPLLRGGEHVIENVVVCCRSCNSSKGARTLDEWRAGERGHRLAHHGVSVA